ncbi:MAG: CDP-diacylglycerol--serine O-phosphatidyltransferase [Gammaproteobacteria bacterium RIFCSPLOWO2_02_FULL_42_14]|nr:MAG: CDP-diacylglycerol--serine O-phosphatidyltransferase [Gammaproteobacteria bacterium RIFCSPHIGHO2_02_FULL_42_43]OGT28887.1 MAG: CDP-diacylglycerol--serine O-phosphatidyltransferase [Gammaproteobacteria bacterium RIFCSPHIGHO2_01_FULL_42_8]OGT51954.1 MAG: CDP-diacylglycerol--serine O-phosphatidyltransferase [Gammaproteobacteria bacterium RIFCSPHIGHO2_12_FULL_41_25]OGT61059.1 MAG: CDP-diacylglycerol--serine O-phosphatidyltransferase [Gammaproteobacteria bacterium RIFCSPLOWO2_02_FULL_42_14]O
MQDDEKSPFGLRRGIYLLPNLFTVGALFAGFYAIVAATHGLFDTAAIAIFIAMLLDGLDGRIARLTQTQSEFGAQMDNMSDMVCFGVTPALVLYEWSLRGVGKIGWLVAFIYTVCTALRLARFLSLDDHDNKRYSRGLTTTAAAGFIASVLWFCVQHNISGDSIKSLVLVITLCVSLLKVSTVPYRSFKDFDARNKISFLAIVGIVLAFAFVVLDPPDVFLAVFGLYVLSGPTMFLFNKIKSRNK